ncbi:serine peptidase [Streptomyces hawaiiensis]|uniref:serine peptidase n=1 Tax=Streptomyces hawaiiensis TaxID=67305 RepID=UPI00365A8ABD
MRILGVHGVGNFRPNTTPEQASTALARIWTKALATEAARPGQSTSGSSYEVEVAYYADLLQQTGRQGEDDLDSLDAFELALVEQWLDEMGVPDATAAGRATAPIRQALAWLARSRGLGRPATEWFVAVFFREVAAYLRAEDSSRRAAARNRVAGAVAAHRPQVVLAHSLGSVVAYEALWAHPTPGVELLVTLGSPLALPHAVFDRLRPEPRQHRGAKPPGVRRWVNVADPGDLVAIPPGGVEDRFDGVERDRPTAPPIHAFDFHKAANYLASPYLHALLTGYV